MPPLVVVGLVAVLAALAGGAAAATAAAVAFRRGEGVFRCRVRVRGSRQRWWRDRGGWPRRPARARWVHDVLLVRRGLLVGRVQALAVHAPENPVRRAARGEVPGLGAEPLRLDLRLDDGPAVEVAARSVDRMLLVGPFLAAAVRELPEGPVERRPHP